MIRNHREGVIKRNSLEQQSPQVTIGHGTFESSILVYQQENARASPIQFVKGIAHCRLARDANIRNIQLISPLTNSTRRYTYTRGPRLYIGGDHRTSANDRVVPDAYARQYVCASPNKHPISYPNIASQGRPGGEMTIVAHHAFMIDNRPMIDNDSIANCHSRGNDGTRRDKCSGPDIGTISNNSPRMHHRSWQASCVPQHIKHSRSREVVTDTDMKSFIEDLHVGIETLDGQVEK